MPHELFITHCTNGTLIMNPFIFMFHHNFYPKSTIDLKDTEIFEETRHKLQVLQQNYDDIVSKHNSDIRRTHLEDMTIDTDPNFPPS